MTESKIQLVVVTGMSGAGKTVAIQSFEDLGYFTIDNMPPALLPKFIELMRLSPDNNKLAVVVDMRSRSFFNEIPTVLDELDNQEDLDFKVLFLDATDSELVARYKEPAEAILWQQMGVSWMGLPWSESSCLRLKILVKMWSIRLS